MPKVIIDGTEYEVSEGRNMLQAALDNSLDLPYFCWHPAMGSVGACRLCAVRAYKDESDTKGRIQMACMTPANEGTRISINDPEAAEFRRYVIEWLMTNHPHDCPVCDEGGECHLQDMTTMCGQVYRRFRFAKRTYTNQNLGPFVTHEMNRCIQCYRCVRFYRDLAGGSDFDFFGSRNRIYFGRQREGVLQSEFSGNLVEVCPTGVFTDKTSARHYTRKWDLETAPSVCIHCGLGCNTIPGSRYGTMRRVVSRFNGDVNGYFLCDRGRFGYEFADCGMRPSTGSGCAECGHSTSSGCVGRAKEVLGEAKGVIGVGSPRASLESNYALRKLVGVEHFSTGLSAFDQEGVGAALDALRGGPARTPSLAEVELADVIVVIGVDPTNEAPMLDFAIRQAMRKAPLDVARKLRIPDWDANAVANALQDAKGKLYIAAPWALKLEEIAAGAVRVSPREVAGFARKVLQGSDDELASRVAADLAEARVPLIVTGVAAGADVIRSAAELAQGLCARGKDCGLFITVPEANTMGAAMMGGLCVEEAARKIESGEADTLVVLENDLARRLSGQGFASLIEKTKNLIVLDCIETATSRASAVLLPITTFFETDGTFVSNEGRAQRFYSVHPPREGVLQAWVVIQELGGWPKWSSYEDALRELASEKPEFAPALEAAPFADWRSAADQKVARDPNRFSGRTATPNGKEPQPIGDQQTPLSYSMEGDQNPPAASPLIPRFWWPGWNSNNSINKLQIEVGGALHGGNPGKRLIEPGNAKSEPIPHSAHPEPVEGRTPHSGEVWLVPRPYIFGSEELSSRAPAIAGLIPPAEALVHPELARRVGLADDQMVSFEFDGQVLSLPVRVDDSVAVDVVTVPMGFPETQGVLAPTIARIV
jgi:NADH-quinone oxidoreductase subunit G